MNEEITFEDYKNVITDDYYNTENEEEEVIYGDHSQGQEAETNSPDCDILNKEDITNAGYHKAFKWGVEETNYMLHLFSRNIKNVGPLKPLRTKKIMWNCLANEINKKYKLDLNAIQVESRYKCVIRRTKNGMYKDHNTLGSAKIKTDTEIDSEINEFVKMNDTVHPEYLISAGKVKKNNSMQQGTPKTFHISFPGSSSGADHIYQTPNSIEDNSIIAPQGRQRKTVQEILFEKFMDREEERTLRKEELKKQEEANKERRHQEKIKILKGIFYAIREKQN